MIKFFQLHTVYRIPSLKSPCYLYYAQVLRNCNMEYKVEIWLVGRSESIGGYFETIIQKFNEKGKKQNFPF